MLTWMRTARPRDGNSGICDKTAPSISSASSASRVMASKSRGAGMGSPCRNIV